MCTHCQVIRGDCPTQWNQFSSHFRSIWISWRWSGCQQGQKGRQLSKGKSHFWLSKLSDRTPSCPPLRSALWATSWLPGLLLPSSSCSYSLTSRCYIWIHLTFSSQTYQIYLDELIRCDMLVLLRTWTTKFWQRKRGAFLQIWESGNFYWSNPCVLSHFSLLNLIILMILLFTWKIGPH